MQDVASAEVMLRYAVCGRVTLLRLTNATKTTSKKNSILVNISLLAVTLARIFFKQSDFRVHARRSILTFQVLIVLFLNLDPAYQTMSSYSSSLDICKMAYSTERLLVPFTGNSLIKFLLKLFMVSVSSRIATSP